VSSIETKIIYNFIEKMLIETDRVEAAIDNALEFFSESNKRIAEMEKHNVIQS